MKPTLLILAAGMGSRYGGLKQIDGIGPNQEPIIEYSIYDAINSGFGKIVFVIRKEYFFQHLSLSCEEHNFVLQILIKNLLATNHLSRVPISNCIT